MTAVPFVRPPKTKAQLPVGLAEALFSAVPCVAAVLDRDLRLVAANPLFEAVFGEVASRAPFCYEVYRRQTSPCAECTALAAFAENKRCHGKEISANRDGTPILLRIEHVPIQRRGSDGEVEHLLQLALLPEQLDARINDLQQQLRQAERLASVGLTTAGLAHTIKNILAGLEGGIYVVNSGLRQDDADRVGAGWAMVQKYIEQVNALVRNLLRFARSQRPEMEEVSIAAIIDEVLELFESKADLVDVDLVATVDEGLEAQQLRLDRAAIVACLTNLVTNAFDACVWDPDQDKSHRIGVHARVRPGGGVVLEVSDNGTGISEENQLKALTSSFTTKGIRGTGLGLLLTKKTVQQHGGEITFRSTVGQGTTFRIDLPPSAPSDDEPSAGADGEPPENGAG